MANSSFRQLVVGSGVLAGVMGIGYMLMKLTAPDRDEMLKVLYIHRICIASNLFVTFSPVTQVRYM